MSDKIVSQPQYEAALNEISLLRDKLDSKSCALIILSQELLECKSQRDQFKLMGEQLRLSYSQLKRKMEGLGPSLSSVYDYDSIGPGHGAGRTIPQEPLAQLLVTLQEQNKHLIREIDDLRMKLEDAEGDLKIVRGQMRSMSQHLNDSNHHQGSHHDYDLNLVEELEFFKNKVLLLERDLQSILDEKEELILSRDSYKLKMERLNEKLNQVLRTNNKSVSSDDNKSFLIDIDSMLMENRFLKEKIKSLDEEKILLNKKLVKFKDALEKQLPSPSQSGPFSPSSKPSSSLSGPLSSSSAPSCPTSLSASSIVSSKQIEQLISSDALNQLDVTPSNLAHLRSLIIALFEELQDKTTHLNHSKKMNKILGKRIEELEKQVFHIRTTDTLTTTANKPLTFDIKNSSLESSSSSIGTNTTATASPNADGDHDDATTTTPDDIDNEDKDNEDSEGECHHQCDDDNELELPPELDRLVKEAMRELRENEVKQIDKTND